MTTRTHLRTASAPIRLTLGAVVGISAILAMYMSWGALHDLALAAGGMPADRAAVFPLVVDLPAVGALLIVLFVPASTLWLRVLPWVTSTVFAVVTIAGNTAAVRLIDPRQLALGPEAAIAIGAVPPVAFLLLAHLAVVTVYRIDDVRTARAKRRPEPAVRTAPVPNPAPHRTAVRSSAPVRTAPNELAARTEARATVIQLVSEGHPVRTAARLACTAPSNAQRWVDKARELGELPSESTKSRA